MFNVTDFERRRKGEFGKTLYYFEELESTNILALELAKENCPEGTVILANSQTAGKGRKGNFWFSPADTNLYFTIVLKPDRSRLHYIPFCSGLAVARALEIAGITADLKWPNDVLVNGRKIAGTLIETSIEQGNLQYAIVGCGINVNTREFPEEWRRVATSVFLERQKPLLREAFLASVLFELERLYGRIEEISWQELISEVEKHSSYFRDCEVKVKLQDEIVEGLSGGLDEFGGLIVNTAGGRKVVYAGEVLECRKK